MTRFLFWNLSNKPLQHLVAALAEQYEVDVLMFAECTISPGILLPLLNEKTVEYNYAPSIGCDKIEIYTRFSEKFIPPVYEEDRFTVRHLGLPGSTSILLAVTYSISKTSYDERDQTFEAANLANELKATEQRVGHTRSILVGDLNMNPFEDGVVNASGLHGVISQRIAQQKTRMVQGKSYPFFYNPMWNLLGDFSPGPPGTYYYRVAQQKVFFWNMFDQVLVRPDLLDRFDMNGLKIIENVGSTSLLSEQGIPDGGNASDHLPLLFKLDL